MLTELIEPSLSELIFVSYEGDVDDDTQAYHGQGSAVLDSGCKYDGNFVNGMMHGQGKFSWPDGVDYEGEFVYGRMTGMGAYFWPDGSSYKGPVDDGLRHGKGGVFKCSAGQMYDGEWERGKRQGKGKMAYTADGLTVYTGDWVGDKRDGYGMMKYSSGNTYEGFWSSDLKTGRGVMTWKTADELYVGDWLNDQPHGNGEHIWGLGHATVPASTTTNNNTNKTPTETPVVYNTNRQVCNMYRGEWAYGKRHGAGTFFYSNGSQYTGQWVNNLKHGEGVFVSPLGNIAVGDFEDDKMLLPAPAPIVSATIANTRPAAAAVNAQTGVRKTNPGGAGKAGLGASRGMQSGVSGKKGAAVQTPSLRGTDDVGNQVTLNIADALSTLPQPKPKRDPSVIASSTASVAVGDSTNTAVGGLGSPTNTLGATTSPAPGSTVVNSIGATSCGFYRQDLSTLEAQTKELERILLRYNQFTKSIYKRYAEMSTHNRVGVDTTTSSHGANPDQFTEHWDPVEKLIFRSRALTSSLRMQCMDVEHFLRFCREASLCGTACNAFDLLSCLVDMRNHHNYIAKRAQQDNRRRRRAEAETSQVNDTVLQYLQDPGPLRARVASLLNAEVGPFASAIPGVNRLDDPDTKRSQLSVESLLQRDLRQPILEREFPELLLRVMIREYLLRGVVDPLGPEKDFGHALMAKVTNCMADKVYPISLPAWTDAVPPFVLAYYHPSVQGLLRSHSSVVKALWARLGGEEGTRPSKDAVVRVRNVAAMVVGLQSSGAVSDDVNDIAKLLAAMGLLTLETPSATNNNLAEQSMAVETKESDPGQGPSGEGKGEVGVAPVSLPPPLPPGPDLMCLFRKINYEDFKFLLCHTVLSTLWVYRIPTEPPAAVSGGDDEGETTNAVAEDGEGSAEEEVVDPLPSVLDDEISRAEAGMNPTEVLASRLDLWLPRMDAAALVIPAKWKS